MSKGWLCHLGWHLQEPLSFQRLLRWMKRNLFCLQISTWALLFPHQLATWKFNFCFLCMEKDRSGEACEGCVMNTFLILVFAMEKDSYWNKCTLVATFLWFLGEQWAHCLEMLLISRPRSIRSSVPSWELKAFVWKLLAVRTEEAALRSAEMSSYAVECISSFLLEGILSV